MEIKAEKVIPYADSRQAKAEQVEEMFDNIAHSYDLLNRAMTLGIDRLWRRKVVAQVAECSPARILDVATGTGDLAIQLARAIPGAEITGVDLSEGMLDVGRKKVEDAGLAARITLEKADCLSLPFPDNNFDAITVAFGVRNFEHLEQGYAEMARVLRPGGRLVVLELSVPPSPVVRPFYNIYTRAVIPLMGRIVSADNSAYTYLPRSIAAMPQGDAMLRLMENASLSAPRLHRLTLGVATIYTAEKR